MAATNQQIDNNQYIRSYECCGMSFVVTVHM